MPLQIHIRLNEKAQEELMRDKIIPSKEQIKKILYKLKQENKCYQISLCSKSK